MFKCFWLYILTFIFFYKETPLLAKTWCWTLFLLITNLAYIPEADIVSLKFGEKNLFYINCVREEMLFPSSTFLKMFYNRKKIMKQTSHCVLSGTCSVYSCNVYREVPVFFATICNFVQIFFHSAADFEYCQGNYYKNYAFSKKHYVPASFFFYLRETKFFCFYKAKDRNSFIKFTV